MSLYLIKQCGTNPPLYLKGFVTSPGKLIPQPVWAPIGAVSDTALIIMDKDLSEVTLDMHRRSISHQVVPIEDLGTAKSVPIREPAATT